MRDPFTPRQLGSLAPRVSEEIFGRCKSVFLVVYETDETLLLNIGFVVDCWLQQQPGLVLGE